MENINKKSNYANAYTEVDTILNYLRIEDLNKIPENFIKTIKANKNDNYNFTIDWNKELKDQNILIETRAILFNIFRDYLANDIQKEKIINMQREEENRNELVKQEMYDVNLFENRYIVKNEDKNNEMTIVEFKESFFEKIINKIKKIINIKRKY